MTTAPDGVDRALVRIRDLAGRPRGIGFLADDHGTLVTSHETVDGLARLVLNTACGLTRLVEADAVTALPEADLALVRTEGLPLPPLPVAAAGTVPADTAVLLWADRWLAARVAGTAPVTYAATDRFRLIGAALELTLPDGGGAAPAAPGTGLGGGAAGGPVLDAHSGAVVAVLGAALQTGHRAGVFAVPLRATAADDPAGPLAALLHRNGGTVPAYGPDLNLAGALRLTVTTRTRTEPAGGAWDAARAGEPVDWRPICSPGGGGTDRGPAEGGRARDGAPPDDPYGARAGRRGHRPGGLRAGGARGPATRPETPPRARPAAPARPRPAASADHQAPGGPPDLPGVPQAPDGIGAAPSACRRGATEDGTAPTGDATATDRPGGRPRAAGGAGPDGIPPAPPGRGARPDPVERPAISREFERFSEDEHAVVLGLVGDPGTGRTTELAALADRRDRGPAPAPTVWLRGADLRAEDRSLRDAVVRALAAAGRVVASSGSAVLIGDLAAVTPEAVAASARGAGRPLFVLLDAPEEMPPPLAHRLAEWTWGTAAWLREADVRLVIGCRPEHWERAGALFPHGSLYRPARRPAGGRFTGEPRPPAPARPLPDCVRLDDLTPREAERARAYYGLPEDALTDRDARHPLVLRLLAEVRAALPGPGPGSGSGEPSRAGAAPGEAPATGPGAARPPGGDHGPAAGRGRERTVEWERTVEAGGAATGGVVAAGCGPEAAHPPVTGRCPAAGPRRGDREPWAAAGRTAPPDRWEIFAAHLDLVCLRIAVRLVAAESPPVRGPVVRRLAAKVAGQVHEAARRCLGPGQGELDRGTFEELFPWRTGWASAVLTEELLVPAGTGYRFAHEEFADWLQGMHLDLEAALYALVHRGAAGRRRRGERPRARGPERSVADGGGRDRAAGARSGLDRHVAAGDGPDWQAVAGDDPSWSVADGSGRDRPVAAGDGPDWQAVAGDGPERSVADGSGPDRYAEAGSGRDLLVEAGAGSGWPRQVGDAEGWPLPWPAVADHALAADHDVPGRAHTGPGTPADPVSPEPDRFDAAAPDLVGIGAVAPAAPVAPSRTPVGTAPAHPGPGPKSGARSDDGLIMDPWAMEPWITTAPARPYGGARTAAAAPPAPPAGPGSGTPGPARGWARVPRQPAASDATAPPARVPAPDRSDPAAVSHPRSGPVPAPLIGPATGPAPDPADEAGPDDGRHRPGPRPLPVPRHRIGPVVQAMLLAGRRHGPAALGRHLAGLAAVVVRSAGPDGWAPGAEATGQHPDPAWWAAHLLGEVLLRVERATPYLDVLTELAGRFAERPAHGRRTAGPGAAPDVPEEFGPWFWSRLPLSTEDRLELLRLLLPADGPPPSPVPPAPRVPSTARTGARSAADPERDGPLAARPPDRFLPAVAALLAADPCTVQPLLCRWFTDERPLATAGAPAPKPRPTVAAAAQALLYAHRHRAVDDLVEALVDAAHPRAEELLGALTEDEPSAMCRAVDRWAHDERPERRAAAATYGPPTAERAATRTDRGLLRRAALALLARPAEGPLHGVALALLVRDPATRPGHLPQALELFVAGHPHLPPSALLAAVETHPEPVLEAFRTRIHGDGPAVGEALRELARIRDPEPARRVVALVRELIDRRPRGARYAAEFVDRRLEQGPAVRADLYPLVLDMVRERPAQVRRALAPVLAAPGTPLSRPLRAELLEVLLEHERYGAYEEPGTGCGNAAVLEALLRAAADGAAERGEARTRDLVHRTGLLLARTQEGAGCFDRWLVQLAREVPGFARLVCGWVETAPEEWTAVIGAGARRECELLARNGPQALPGRLLETAVPLRPGPSRAPGGSSHASSVR